MAENYQVDKIWTLSPLDKLLQLKKSQRNAFIALFERKEILLDLIKDYKIDPKKYKKLVIVSCKDSNEIIKSCGMKDIEKLKDAKDSIQLDQWFKQMIENTGSNYEKQLSQYQQFKSQKEQSLLKGTTVKQVQQSLMKMAQTKLIKSSIKPAQKPQIDLTQIVSLRAMDKVMQDYQDNYEIYQKVFDRKAKIFALMKKQQLTPEKYKLYLEAFLKKNKDEDIMFQTKMEYEHLADFHDGNVATWFQEIFKEAEAAIEDQKRKLVKLKYRANAIQQSSSKADKLQTKQAQKAQLIIPKDSSAKKNLPPLQTIYSFKAITDLLENNKNNSPFSKMARQRKDFLKKQIQTGALTAQKYKKLIQQNFKMQSISQEIKESIKFELDLINDIHQGNTQQWFKDIVAEVLLELSEYQQDKQENVLNSKRKNNLQVSNNKIQTSRVNIVLGQSNVSSIEHSPDIRDPNEIGSISNLKVLEMMLNNNKGNPEMFTTLFERKQQILSQVKSGVIDAPKYHLTQQQQAEKANSVHMKNAVVLDLSRIKTNYNSNLDQWFQALITESEENCLKQNEQYLKLKAMKNQKKQLLNPVKKSISLKKKDENRQRTTILIKAMARYESLLYYHKKNKIPYRTHKYLIQYEKTKKNIYHYIEQIEQDKNIDVQNLVDELFPPINQHIFYAGELQTFKAKIKPIREKIRQEMVGINEYTQMLKKHCNVQNLKNANKDLENCQLNLKFLNNWPQGIYQAFPQVKQQKVVKINTDLNKLEPNQIQLIITKINGLGSEHFLNVHFFQANQTKYSYMVNDGEMNNIIIKEKLSEGQMNAVIKASQSFIGFKIYKKSFFGNLDFVAQSKICPRFTRVNTVEQKAKLENIQISYIAKVQKPKSPISKEITHCRITKFPVYEHSMFVEEELIKKFIPYSNPSPSEIEG